MFLFVYPNALKIPIVVLSFFTFFDIIEARIIPATSKNIIGTEPDICSRPFIS